MFAELTFKTTGRNISSPALLQIEHRKKTLSAEEWNEIKGSRDEGYGSVGTRSQKVKILKLTENKLNEYFADNRYSVSANWRR